VELKGHSRIEQARLRASGAKWALVAGAAASFVAAAGLARVSHPGEHASPSTASSASISDEESDDNFEFDGGTISSSSGAGPNVQTNVS
jgi:hypothetical protein